MESKILAVGLLLLVSLQLCLATESSNETISIDKASFEALVAALARIEQRQLDFESTALPILSCFSSCSKNETPIVNGTDQPISGTTAAPISGTTAAPISGTTAAPISGTTAAPISGTTAAPIPATTVAPIPETTAAPNLTTTLTTGRWAIKRRLSDRRISFFCVGTPPCMQTADMQTKFQFTKATSNGGSDYFYIHDRTYAFGIGEPWYMTSTKAVRVPIGDMLKTTTPFGNERFQWRIVQNGTKYVRFVNRASQLTLDNDDGMDYLYNMQDHSYMLCQEWEILPVT